VDVSQPSRETEECCRRDTRETDIDMVMSSSGCPRFIAEVALQRANNDVISATLQVAEMIAFYEEYGHISIVHTG